MLSAAALGYELNGPPRWSLAPPPHAAVMPARRYAVVLHATSREGKLWAEERWRALIGDFASAGIAVLLPWGSGDERERSERLAAGFDATIVPAAAVAWRPRGADRARRHRRRGGHGIDASCPAALGTPTVALFTETDPAGAGVALAGPHARPGRMRTHPDTR